MSPSHLARLAALTAVAACFLIPSTVSAAPTATSCSTVGVVLPVLGGPGCWTPAQVCQGSVPLNCVVRANLAASQVAGLGRTRARIAFYRVGDPHARAVNNCSAPK